jgi:uncharacterized membrane protein YkgB
MNTINKVFEFAARLDRAGITLTYIGLVAVLVWIGSLKVSANKAVAARELCPATR